MIGGIQRVNIERLPVCGLRFGGVTEHILKATDFNLDVGGIIIERQSAIVPLIGFLTKSCPVLKIPSGASNVEIAERFGDFVTPAIKPTRSLESLFGTGPIQSRQLLPATMEEKFRGIRPASARC